MYMSIVATFKSLSNTERFEKFFKSDQQSQSTSDFFLSVKRNVHYFILKLPIILITYSYLIELEN